MIEYSAEYNGYWQRPDRVGTSSFASPLPIAREILAICGQGRLLDIGCGMGVLVRTLLDMGVDAHGVDVSSVVVGAANRLAPGRFASGSAIKLPFADGSFETVISTDCLEHLAPEDVAAAFSEIRRICRRHVYLRIATGPDRDNHWHLTIEGRAWWERAAFAAGFRKHPGYYRVNAFEALEHDPYSVTIPLERVEDGAFAIEAQTATEADPINLDMLRQTGRLSDADLVRFKLAAEHVLPERAVVVLPCGRGHGCAVLFDSSDASRVIGVDASSSAIHHARANYARKGIEFIEHGAASLAFLDANSVGTVVALGLPHERSPSDTFLKEVARVLVPGGRLVLSVPGETGKGFLDTAYPAAPRFARGHRITLAPAKAFAVESLVAVYAGGRPHEQNPARRLVEIVAGMNLTAVPDSWLAVAILDDTPDDCSAPALPEVDPEPAALCVTTRATVHRGATDEAERKRLAGLLGACLQQAGVAASQASAHATSIAYLLGRLHQQAGEMDQARRFYLRAVELSADAGSSQVAADQIDAAFRCGLLALGCGDHPAAQHAWNQGIACAQRWFGTAGDFLCQTTGRVASPLTSPLLLVADGVRRCATGLRLLQIADDKPGFVATRLTDSFEAGVARMQEDASSCEAALREQLARLQGEMASTTRDYAKTLDSYSWRITAPLRMLADIVRGWTR
jgi:SAM-dependent methyltransferase